MLVEKLLDVLPFITMAPTVSLFYQYCWGLLHTLVEVLVVVLSFITMT